jgi:two-component sensor histidine kinase/DNA-binding response OmpR family regulator
MMNEGDSVKILLVDDQPAKLLSYEVILRELGENLIKASSAREALELLLKHEIAVVLVDVCMPDLDGFQLAQMVREHPRFQRTAIIFISAVHLTEVDALRGYEMGAVDYVPVPVVPEVLRAKVRIFVELYRKSRQLEQLNRELEQRVGERTAELKAANTRLTQSEQLRSLALAAGQMGSWSWDAVTGECTLDEGQYRILGIEPGTFEITAESVRGLIHPEDLPRLEEAFTKTAESTESRQTEFRIRRPSGEIRWCIGTVAARRNSANWIVRVSGVTVDITSRKNAEEHQVMLAREVDHRSRNVLAVVQSVIRLTRAETIAAYIKAVEGRVGALSRAHTLLSRSRWEGADLASLASEELAPYRSAGDDRAIASGPSIILGPAVAQTLALVLHELATNAAKYGALSAPRGKVSVTWNLTSEELTLRWVETGGPQPTPPSSEGYGTRVINATVEGQLEGQVLFDWRPEGLCCTIVVRRSGNLLTGLPPLVPLASECEARLLVEPLKGKRLLLVEDEALVAMMIEDLLGDLGFEVVGPFGNIAEAESEARAGAIDAAVLDVNVGGQLAYPLADLLIARGVPIAFVTGYGRESVDSRFSDVPILQKPIEQDLLRSIFALPAESAPSELAEGETAAA